MNFNNIGVGDLVELVFSALLLAGYSYARVIMGVAVNDPVVDALVIMAVGSVFGNQARKFLGRRPSTPDDSSNRNE